MSFIVTSDITIVGVFSQNGFNAIKPGAAVKLVFDNDPGRLHDAKITEIPENIGAAE
jgi:multidrug resistance efflux pump